MPLVQAIALVVLLVGHVDPEGQRLHFGLLVNVDLVGVTVGDDMATALSSPAFTYDLNHTSFTFSYESCTSLRRRVVSEQTF